MLKLLRSMWRISGAICATSCKLIAMFYVLLDNLRSLHNVGSIFRTADAAGVDKIFLCGITGKPTDPKVKKVSLGAENTVPWEYTRQAWRVVDQLKKEGFQIVALEQTTGSINFRRFHRKKKMVLVVGNEVNGVSPALLKRSDVVVEIPMRGKKESLNVSVAFGIAVFQLVPCG